MPAERCVGGSDTPVRRAAQPHTRTGLNRPAAHVGQECPAHRRKPRPGRRDGLTATIVRSMSETARHLGALPIDYAGLVARHPPRPIRDEFDAADVEAIVMEMAGHALSPGQEDYHELLSD